MIQMERSLSGSTLSCMNLKDKEGLLAANKLNERHIQWNPQKMKVKLAARR